MLQINHQLSEIANISGTQTLARLPRVGIVVSNFNYSEYVEDCLASIFAQTYRGGFDVIVVDDASTDGSLALLGELQARWSFRLIVNPQNSGQTASLRAGLAELDPAIAFVQFVDADDMLRFEAVENLLTGFLWAGSNAGVIGGMAAVVDANGALLTQPKAAQELAIETIAPGDCHIWDWPVRISTSGMMFRRALAAQALAAVEDEFRTCTDRLLAAHAHQCLGTATLNAVVLDYRLHGRNSWATAIRYGSPTAGGKAAAENVPDLYRCLARIHHAGGLEPGAALRIASYVLSEQDFLRLSSYTKLKKQFGRRLKQTSVRRRRAFHLKKFLRLGARGRNIWGDKVSHG